VVTDGWSLDVYAGPNSLSIEIVASRCCYVVSSMVTVPPNSRSGECPDRFSPPDPLALSDSKTGPRRPGLCLLYRVLCRRSSPRYYFHRRFEMHHALVLLCVESDCRRRSDSPVPAFRSPNLSPITNLENLRHQLKCWPRKPSLLTLLFWVDSDLYC